MGNLSFTLICDNCGEKASVNVYESEGIIPNTQINTSFDIDEDDLDRVELIIECYKCGNSIKFTK
ncbi:hypothetical protein [Clostridium tertium]|jgi:hypothetical protein|uniref:hypothetical protein n=1 Tax=Clostridium tertium TaxID=1559 RepID=UPI001C1E34FD|nr:hypothetical protein [Clostridium tertium]MBU6135203.1 hypothetical protein [Clostridium tertium]